MGTSAGRGGTASEESRRLEDKLQKSEARWQFALEGAGDGLWDWNLKTNEVYYSKQWKAMLGYEEDEIGGTLDDWDRLIHPDEKKSCHESLQRCLEGLEPEYRREHRLRCKDGSYTWVLIRGMVIEWDDNNRPLRAIGTHADISERKRTEEQLAERKRFLESITAMTPDLIYLFYVKELRHAYINREVASALGFSTEEEALSLGAAVIHPEDLPSVLAQLDLLAHTQSDATHELEYRIRRKDGTYAWFYDREKVYQRDSAGQPEILFGICQDITERKQAEAERLRLEQQVQQAQKLESLGVLAGGIAHDFNNLMTGIFGYVDLARSMSSDPQILEHLDVALGTIERARGLTRQLLTFAKGGAPAKRPTPLLPLIKKAVQFALSGSSVSCSFDLAEELWTCDVDKDQIGQVIDNIVINAQQAMPNGGNIEVSARNVSLAGTEYPALAKGDVVRVSIKDSGIGIPGDVLPRIFDPFYTTKTKGHGLGLATCYSIINRHGGAIEVESEPGVGSTFHIYLPAAAASAVEKTPPSPGHKGSGTVIVVDDEAVVRETLRRMLERMGYTVVCKSDGRGAVDLFADEESRRAVAAVILDLTIPGGMGGMAAIAEIRKIDKEVPAFMASGYAENGVMKDPAAYGFTASLCKPFKMTELAELLERHLRRG
jgi:two-component system, cell cycle sensor histidine kinase and response regulator CckA